MKELYLVRHCEAEGQEPEADLTKRGHLQAERLAAFFEKIDLHMLISSPFVRAVETAMPIAKLKKLIVKEDERLSERVLSSGDLPDWMDRLKASFADPELKMTGGESASEAAKRGWEVIEEEAGISGTTVLVTHGNLLALILKNINPETGFDEWRALSNPDVYKLCYENNSWAFSRVWTEKAAAE
ncbi:histidine phosphatase family protein [Jeotgalibacillus sp. R-1-5s-1]|uniref:histidine phosphatase family protein n=1 Tax=Jeotgalibacillus sp. R-1-5s-1 TaxID=2555897 RepID=UPI00106D79D8|nr:histidine phosphatase family protein [Jeotgalibacillus sp. R-1-5s-1]TFE00784.1 histidine phosphatase family protein [Jeotgalibacillus sp. R-1-5s-1]